jgi:uncharacterized lipoprotein
LQAGSVAQSGSAQSTRPSPSLSLPSVQLVSMGMPYSVPLQAGSVAQSGSAQSTRPSPSLSLPSVQSYSMGKPYG